MRRYWENPEEQLERILALVSRWKAGEFSETVFTASLIAAGCHKVTVDELTTVHRAAFRQSLPYLRGDVS